MTTIPLSSNTLSVRTPASVSARSSQSVVRFAATADPVGGATTAVITAQTVNSSVQTNLTLPPAPTPRLASHSEGAPVSIIAGNLPAGAQFDAGTGVVTWQPTEKELGTYQSSLQASAAMGATTPGVVPATVGQPALNSLENGASADAPAACSPGSIATLTGRSLYAGAAPARDYSGSSSELEGTRVLVNGESTPVLFASAERVSFRCPSLAAGAGLKIAIETAAGTSNLLERQMASVAPGILTLGAAKAVAMDESGELSQIPTPQHPGLPVLPGGVVTLWTTGISCEAGSDAQLTLEVSQQPVAIQSIAPSVSHPGVCEIAFQALNVAGDSVPVVLEARGMDGQTRQSNTATIAVAKQ
jgi:uncharacterized protein (TIGR03437 family)